MNALLAHSVVQSVGPQKYAVAAAIAHSLFSVSLLGRGCPNVCVCMPMCSEYVHVDHVILLLYDAFTHGTK